MVQMFMWDDPPQPYPSDLINILRKESIDLAEKPPRCYCHDAPESGCIC